jgi:hypothetical protein
MQAFDPYGLEYRRVANIALDNLRHQGYPYPSQEQLNSDLTMSVFDPEVAPTRS